MSYEQLEHIIDEVIDRTKKLILFDIGAFNFGDSIIYKTNIPLAEVYAFEADDFNIKKYSDYARRFDIKIINKAVSDKTGDAVFYNSTTSSSGEWTCSGSLLRPTYKIFKDLKFNDDGIKVETIRLDEFCIQNNIENVDIIHMDIQGAEYYAVKGFGETVRPKLLFCETCEYDSYHGSLTLEDLDNLLFSLGYEIKKRWYNDTLYILK
tara:strand:- start:209 stop:832 length:624 start_codon:yes stop_codon:yes gene_type:complete